MNIPTINIILFTVFAFSLSVWGMQHNGREKASVSACYGDCYKEYEESNGGVVAIAQAQAAAKAEASPAELGKNPKGVFGALLRSAQLHGGSTSKLASEIASS